MNYENNEMLTSPFLSYTSRDFNSIYTELMNSIPTLTSEWNPTDENDPGVVIIKLISMLGDMLSYNQDKMALEAFPRTVLQRANGQQIFRLIGYKMHWWRSAKIDVTFRNSNTFNITIGRYNVFSTNNNTIYTNIKQIELPHGTSQAAEVTYELIQGLPVTPSLKSSIKPANYNEDWHTPYDYNIDATKILNNRIYLKYPNVDESSITLIDNDETPFMLNEWTQVNNINTSENLDKVFEFDVDEENQPFIQLPSYWQERFVITKFKIFFVLSDGKNGEIEENTLTNINTQKCYTNSANIDINSALSLVNMTNTPSTYGYNPETCVEARNESEKFQNTIDTLVTLPDFEKATMRIESVANVIATDIQTDPHPEELKNNQLNLYIVRKDDYNNASSTSIYDYEYDIDNPTDELFKENVVGELSSYKLSRYDLNVKLENNIDWIDWSITGQLYLRQPINNEQNRELMVRINTNLKNKFNCETLDFNERINYMDVIECIMETDKNIWHVDLDTAAIQYSRVKRNLLGNPTGLTIQNKYKICINNPEENYPYTGYYATSIGCINIEVNSLTSQDLYNNTYNNSTSGTRYLPGNESNDVSNVVTLNGNDTIAPGGNENYSNDANKIIKDNVYKYIELNLSNREGQGPYEYEIYNRRIYDWTGYDSIDTGYIIVPDTNSYNKYLIKKEQINENGQIEYKNTEYCIIFNSHIYLSDGTDTGQYLVDSTEIIPLINENIEREVYIIYDDTKYPTGEVIDKLTGEIFIKRGNTYYRAHKSFDEQTGNICDTYGKVLYGPNESVLRDVACKEDVTCEYVQEYEVIDDNKTFDFYLGQDVNGIPLTDENNKAIEAYPIKPYSLFIYIDGDAELLGDNGCGRIQGTTGILDGYGSIDYSTGHVSFNLNIVPESNLKIIYKVNRLTYARYLDFDPTTFYVNPAYLKSDIRK